MKKCIECENEMMLKYSDLAIDYYSELDRIKLLEEALNITRQLCDFYAIRCNELENKLREKR